MQKNTKQIENEAEFQQRYAYVIRTLQLQDQTAFLASGFNTFLSVQLPIILLQEGFFTAYLEGSKYLFSISKPRAYQSGTTPTDCFDFGLAQRIPITGLIKLEKLLEKDVNNNLDLVPKQLISKVRTTIFQFPIPSGRAISMYEPCYDDKRCIENQFLPSGCFIVNGKMRTFGCGMKIMTNSSILLVEKRSKGFVMVQVRSVHWKKPFRCPSSLNFIIDTTGKKADLQGVVQCEIPHCKSKLHTGILAQAVGCNPRSFIDLVQKTMGTLYNPIFFRPYEESLEHLPPLTQEQAMLYIADTFGKKGSSTGINQVKTEVLSHINITLEENKEFAQLHQLKLIYIAKCFGLAILLAAKQIPPTSRDWFRYSTIQTPIQVLGNHIRTVLREYIQTRPRIMGRKFQNVAKQGLCAKDVNLIELWAEPKLSTRLLSAIASGNFTTNERVAKGITRSMNLHNEESILDESICIQSSLKKTDAQHSEPRQVQMDGCGYIDPAYCPDGEGVGLRMKLAIFATITPELEDPEFLISFVEELFEPYLMTIESVMGEKLKEACKHQQPKQTETNLSDITIYLEPDKADKTKNVETDNVETDEKLEKNDNVDREIKTTKMNNEINKTGKKIMVGQETKEKAEKAEKERADKVKKQEPENKTTTFEEWKPTYYTFFNNCGIITHFIRGEQLQEFISHFQQCKRQNILPWCTFLELFEERKEVHLVCQGGQLARPLIIASEVQRLQPNDSFQDALMKGIVEYVNVGEEQSLCHIAPSFTDFQKLGGTHIELSQISFLSASVASVPFVSAQHGPRVTHFAQQIKQKITAWPKREHGFLCHTQLYYPQKSLITSTTAINHIASLPIGKDQLVTFVLLSLEADQEDATVMCKASNERGLFNCFSTRYYTSDATNKKNAKETFEKKQKNVLLRKNVNFDTIESNGLPKVGTFIPGGGLVIGKTKSIIKLKRKAEENNIIVTTCDMGTTTREEEAGYVQSVKRVKTPNGCRVTVAITTNRPCDLGEKLSTRNSGKGIVGQSANQEDLPYSLETGTVYDVYIASLSPAARMTLSSLFETMAGKGCCLNGKEFVDHHDLQGDLQNLLEPLGSILTRYGFSPKGTETFICGKTGKLLQGQVFCGVIEMARLNHMASKKIHARGLEVGPRDPLSRAPKCGANIKQIGYKVGEMELAAIAGFGASTIMQLRCNQLSDPFTVYVCKKCKLLADGNEEIRYRWCRSCQSEEEVLQVAIPRSCLVCIQELFAMGILVRIAVSPLELEQSKHKEDMWLKLYEST